MKEPSPDYLAGWRSGYVVASHDAGRDSDAIFGAVARAEKAAKQTTDAREELAALARAVTDYTLAVDKLMVGPSTFERGRTLGHLLGRLEDARIDAEAWLYAEEENAVE